MDAVQAAMRSQIVTRAELDQVAPNNPVYLRTRTSSITNGKAQELIRAGWHGPMEPNLMRDDGFSSNTINRMVLSDHLIGDIEKLAEIYKAENLRWASYGVTTWSSNIRSLRILAAYQLLDQRGEIGIRYGYTPGSRNPRASGSRDVRRERLRERLPLVRRRQHERRRCFVSRNTHDD